MRDRVEIDTSNLGGDFVIVRADGTPLYHFTVVVDDMAMRISHVIRGEDHVSNTPKHILLFEALGYPLPVFGHLPLILNPDGTKMSKRKSQTAVADYIAQGFIREALVNYFAFLGWSPGTEEEVFTLDELVERFDLDKVQKGGALFDRERLEWLNGQWIRRLDDDDLVERLLPFLEAAADRRPDRPAPAATRSCARCCRSSASGCRRWRRSWTSSASCGWTTSRWTRRLLVPKRWDAATTREGLAAARERHRGARRRHLGGGRARAAAPRAGRGARLEGRRPVHGDPRRDDRHDGHPAAVRHARCARPGADARAPRLPRSRALTPGPEPSADQGVNTP